MQSLFTVAITVFLLISCMASVAVAKDAASELKTYDPVLADHVGESMTSQAVLTKKPTRKPTAKPVFKPTAKPVFKPTPKPSFKPQGNAPFCYYADGQLCVTGGH